ncbi:MAG: DUF5995 family protein [Candidatus Binatia bacterium]
MPIDGQDLYHLIRSSPLETVGDVIAVMRGLDGELANDDGLKWFNLLYLKVTEAVDMQPKTVRWENGQWLELLDVNFAKLYFAALCDWQRNRDRVARAWLPLLQSRARHGIKRVQFALAGLNAHINHDLPVALVQTGKASRIVLKRGTAEFRDFERVNSILATVQEDAKRYIATGLVGVIDQSLGDLDDNAANWSVGKARETAWSNGEILWRLNRTPQLRNEFLTNIDRLVSLASRGLLVSGI